MRVLIDESVDVKLRHHFPEHVTAETVAYRGWKGLENGDLLNMAQAEYDALVTLDTNIPDQQHLRRFDIGVLVMRPDSDNLPDLAALIPSIVEALSALDPGEYREVFPPDE